MRKNKGSVWGILSVVSVEDYHFSAVSNTSLYEGKLFNWHKMIKLTVSNVIL